ncbi:hypothetical protein CCACVL1_22067 [Corchorus capsularis]|uniref:Uncharacterized protein n=1 Tax=Corchorus capsularis TaxID=210143 RepID=A0A1R3H141_COCAP|nr:hypothetical protein CCACVL1_22067 [Corchorus capsularis]
MEQAAAYTKELRLSWPLAAILRQ